MDRTDDALEVALEPQTVRTAPALVRTVPGLTAAEASPAAGLPPSELFGRELVGGPAAPASEFEHKPETFVEHLEPRAAGSGFIPPTPLFRPIGEFVVAPSGLALEAPAPVRPPFGDSAFSLAKAMALGARVARVAALLFVGWLSVVVAAICAYRFVDPPASTLMLQRWLAGEDVRHTWVPLEAISPRLVRAVVVSEDGRFCDHWGIDYEAMQIAIQKAGDGSPRGASTISMQVVKNLFLWPSKSYLRKALELPLTYLMEALWPKSRIMEVYLNIAEWGPGVFGVEEAARHHFAKPAFRLSEREAAQLAVTLPNPIRRDAGDPGPGTRRLAGLIQARARLAGRAQFACLPRPGPGR